MCFCRLETLFLISKLRIEIELIKISNVQEKEENKQNKPPSPVISYSLTEQEIEEDLLQVRKFLLHLLFTTTDP